MLSEKKEIPLKTIRIKTKNLKTYEKKSSGWKLIKKEFPIIKNVIELFKAENNFDELIDKKDPVFLKGQLSAGEIPQGARINMLPNGEILEKAYSLFSPHLKIHDETSHDHWDVMYQNKGGTYSYVYTLEKRKQHRTRKYKKVEEFEKVYNKLVNNVKKKLIDETDFMPIPMHTLIKTYIRVGNETYFKAHGHKGLRTLTKENIDIKDNIVIFDYVGKDGVPIKIEKKFSNDYIKRLKNILKNNKGYVFSKNNKTLQEKDFKKAFLNYCGKEFYPHIIRSHHATMEVKKFLKNNKKTTKEEVKKLFLSIAHDLGHKKFNKKKQEWQEHYTVTVNSYVQPELVEKIQKIIKE